MMRRAIILLTMIWLPILILVAWVVSSRGNPTFFYPSTSEIWSSFRSHFLTHDVTTFLLPSLRNLMLGFLMASGIGILAGLLLGLSARASAFFSLPVDFFRSLPGPALLPLFIALFGIGTTMKVSIIAFTAVFPILLNTIDGVRSCDPRWNDVCGAYRISPSRRFAMVVLPGAAPQIATGLRVGLQTSLLLVVVSEMIASTGGVGFLILQSQQTFHIPDMWAGIVMLGLLGFVLNMIFDPLEQRALRWHRASLEQFRK